MPAQIMADLDGVAGLSEDWPSSPDAVSALGQQHAWVMAGAETLVDPGRLRIVAASSGGSSAVAPLIERPIHGRLEFLGLREIGEPMDFSGAADSAIAELVEALVDLKRPILLGRLPSESATIPALRRACRGRALMVILPAPPSPYIALDPSWQDPERRIPKRKRAIRRARQHAAEIGDVRFRLLRPRPGEELDGLLDKAWEVEGSGWKGRLGTALDSVSAGRFFRAYAGAAAQQGIFWISFLDIGDRIAAMEFGVELGGRFWALKTGFDEAFSAAAPGRLLTLETIRHAARMGFRTYELLGAPMPWKTDWTSDVHFNVKVAIYPATSLRTVLALSADAWRIGTRGLGSAVSRRSQGLRNAGSPST